MKTICKNIAFSTAGECLLGKDCICEKNKLWLEETPANCYPEGGGEGEEDRFCPKCGESWEAHSTICRRKPETRAIDVDADEAKGEIEFLDRDNDRLRAALRDIAGGTALPQLIAQQALGLAPEAQPINGDVTDYTAIHGNCQLHGPYVGQCLICNTGVITTSTTNAQPIAASEEVPEEIMQWINDHRLDELPNSTVTGGVKWQQGYEVGAIAMYYKMQERVKEIYEVHKSISDSYNELLPREIKLTADLLAARNKNNDDGIEIARLLAELKEKELIITGIEEGDEQWKAEYENLLATINKTSRSILNVYAPGNYYCNCCHCGEQFQGDKRAVSCLKCALSGHEKYVDELAERNATLLAEKKEYAVNEQKIGRNLLDAYRVISGLLPANSQWQEKYIHKCNDLTVMIDEALQKSKELDALAPEIKRQTIDRLYNEILAAGVEFPPAAREVFHRAMNELTASPTQNPDK